MPYRPDIDGLRAIAVLAVIFFHAGFPLLPGGFVGVDVFFVISGYLITTLLVKAAADTYQSPQHILLNFYLRRTRRIMPALLLVCSASTALALWVLLPHELLEFGRYLLGANTFTANWVPGAEGNYFDQNTNNQPLMHLWSLAIEEQFYLLLPLLVLFCRRWPAWLLPGLIAVGLIYSLYKALATAAMDLPLHFYWFRTRAWELGIGSLTALLPVAGALARPWLLQLSSGLAVIGLLISILLLDESVHYPSAWTLLPVLSTATLLFCGQRPTAVQYLLGYKPLVSIGLISYSAYLLHQPIFAFSRILLTTEPTPLLRFALIGLTLVGAWVIWRWLEQPCRKPDKVATKTLLWGQTITAVSLITVAIVIIYNNGHISQRHHQATALLTQWQPVADPHRCIATKQWHLSVEQQCRYNDQALTHIALWGDSHAHVLRNSLIEQLTAFPHIGLNSYLRAGCLPISSHFQLPMSQQCMAHNEQVLAHLINNATVKTVILHGYWSATTQRHFSLAHRLEHAGKPKKPTMLSAFVDGLSDTVAALQAAGKNVLIIHDVPPMPVDVPMTVARWQLLGAPAAPIISSLQRNNPNVLSTAVRVSTHAHRLAALYPQQLFCDAKSGFCQSLDSSDIPLYMDDNHLSHRGAQRLNQAIIETLLAKGWLYPQ